MIGKVQGGGFIQMEQLNQNNNINIDIVNVEIVRKYINSYFNDSNEFYKSLIEKNK